MQHTASKPPVSVQDGNMATVEEICATLTRHLGLLSSHTMAADHAAAGGGGGAIERVDKAEMAFKLYDKDKDGYITKAEMTKLSKTLTKEQIDKVRTF